MHSSFPPREVEVDEKYLYRPVVRGNIRQWIRRMSRSSQNNIRVLMAAVVTVLFLIVILWRRGNGGEILKQGPVVLVTVLERKDALGEDVRIIDRVLENRREYADAYGYELAVFNLTDYTNYSQSERVWVKLAALRDAMSQYPTSEWFWYLDQAKPLRKVCVKVNDQNAIVMNPSIPLHTHYLSSASLTARPLRDVPVFPPEATVRTPTLRTQPVSQISLILSHGGGILHTGSIILRRGDYADFLLDSWNDPLVRSYGFPGEAHQAFEHLVQWHSTILEGLAVMPKRSLLSFGVAAGDDEQYHEGDFVVHLDGCEGTGRSCEKEFVRYWALRGSLTVENEQIPPKPIKNG